MAGVHDQCARAELAYLMQARDISRINMIDLATIGRRETLRWLEKPCR
jgi:hypothetical protein